MLDDEYPLVSFNVWDFSFSICFDKSFKHSDMFQNHFEFVFFNSKIKFRIVEISPVPIFKGMISLNITTNRHLRELILRNHMNFNDALRKRVKYFLDEEIPAIIKREHQLARRSLGRKLKRPPLYLRMKHE